MTTLQHSATTLASPVLHRQRAHCHAHPRFPE
jgi:hypothetical protein